MRTEPSFSLESENRLLDDVDHIQSDFNFSSSDDEPSSQLLADYRQRYGLSADPFADDHHFPFYTGAHRRKILDQLLHLCQFSNNLLVVVGECGVGKTRMAQALIDALADEDDICFLEGQTGGSFDSLYAEMIEQFELPEGVAFSDFTSKQNAEDGIAVLIIDNAHNLTDTVLLKIINLIQSGAELRLHLVLFAEPYCLPRIEHLDIANVVLTDFSLDKFSLAEAVDYLNYRMEMADYLGPELFTESNVDAWWRQSQGQLLVLHEFAKEKLLQAVAAPRAFSLNRKNLPLPHIIGAAALGALLIMGLLYWGVGGSSSPESVKKDVSTSTSVIPIKVAESSLPIQAASQEHITVASASAAVQIPPNTSPVEAISTTVSSVQPVSTSEAKVASVNNLPQKIPTADTPYVKQSVVPLVQTNNTQVKPVEKLPAANVGTAAEVKKVAPIQESIKPTTKVDIKPAAKIDNKLAEKAKVITKQGNFSEQEKTILSWGESDFTLQIVGLSSEKAVHDFVAEQPNKKDLLVFRSVRQGKSWFVVVAGRYSSSAKARQAVQALPESQKKAVPWPREVKIIQSEIRQR